MAKKRKAKPAERPNPYRNMNNRTLDETRAALLDDYAERLEYFDMLPEWQTPENVKEIKKDPAAWGLTVAELNEWCAVILEHFAAGVNLGDMRAERNRRLYEGERRRVAALPRPDREEAAAEHERPHGPFPYWRLPGESLRAYVERAEAEADRAALERGAKDGAYDADMAEHKKRMADLMGRGKSGRV